MPPRKSHGDRDPTIKRASSDASFQIESSPVDDTSDGGSTDELTLSLDTTADRKMMRSIEYDLDSDTAQHTEHDDIAAAKQIIEDLNTEANAEEDTANIDTLSEELDDTHIDVLSEIHVSEPKSYLQICQEMQNELFPAQGHLKNMMGVWELDILHKEHECYNINLFTGLRPSEPHERDFPTLVYGYGVVRIRVLCDKTSTAWKWMALDNVKYVCAPQVTNHRIGLGALPPTTHYHLPVGLSDDVGDGFLSIDSGVGCALGRLDQGGRRVWALRTYDMLVDDMQGEEEQDMELDDQEISTHRGWFGWIGGRKGSKTVLGKRGREDDDEEPTKRANITRDEYM